MRSWLTGLLLALFGMSLTVGCGASRKAGVESAVQSVGEKTRSKVLPGIDVLLRERLDLLKDKRVGLITNPTGLTSDLRTNIDALQEAGVNLVALFGPEHGVRGDVEAGKAVASYTDAKTGIPVYSLYGKTRKPTPEMLKNVDVLLYDIQDIGSRPYTYISTMAVSMEAARDAGTPFVVLDRPNPLGGQLVEGPVLNPQFKSFIGIYPIPYIYGLTVGELARLFNEEFGIGCDLTVVPMKGWHRDMLFEDTGLVWVPTSPHIPHPLTAFACAATGGMGELGTVNEGVGTPLPFELVGAPWIDAEKLANALNARRLPGVFFRPTAYRPYYFRFKNQQLWGVQIHILDPHIFHPVLTQLHILHALLSLFPSHNIFDTNRTASFDRAWGTDQVRLMLSQGADPESIVASWQEKLSQYREIRRKYLMYE